MAGSADTDFVDALLAAPGGVALLARLEADQRSDVGWFDSPASSDPAAVRRAIDAVGEMSFDAFVHTALEAPNALAGPWMSEAPSALAHAYRCAPDRRPLAEAIASRFGDDLHGTATSPQQWWLCHDQSGAKPTRAFFTDFDEDEVYPEFTSHGLWTVTEPPSRIHDALVDWWELFGSPVSRWELPVAPSARLWTIHRPADWVDLVTGYPKATPSHSGWELPGPNQRVADLQPLLDLPGQNAARTSVRRHLLPDWKAVATDYDGVHLSWAGFLTSEGFVSDLPDAGATMLRYWFSERTLWLADVFGEPAPLPAPTLSGRVSNIIGIDPAEDGDRRDRDIQHMRAQLGR